MLQFVSEKKHKLFCLFRDKNRLPSKRQNHELQNITLNKYIMPNSF